MIKQKGLADYLRDDPSLTEKITYEEFINGKAAPQDEDCSIEEAYEAYKRVMEELNGI